MAKSADKLVEDTIRKLSEAAGFIPKDLDLEMSEGPTSLKAIIMDGIRMLKAYHIQYELLESDLELVDQYEAEKGVKKQ